MAWTEGAGLTAELLHSFPVRDETLAALEHPAFVAGQQHHS